MSSVNRFGLSIDIPDPVKREVRRQSGFGCVICGCAIFEYHHHSPPFADATVHAATGITALCPTCHKKVQSGRISGDYLMQMIDNPCTRQVGFSRDDLERGTSSPEVVLGHATFVDVPIILEVFGKPLFQVAGPESNGGPFRISAHFFDRNGKMVASIIENEWHAYVSNWDVDTVGKRTTIRNGKGDISLIVRNEPPSRLVVERIHMYYRGLLVDGREGEHFSVFLPDGSLWFRSASEGMLFIGCDKGIVFGDGFQE